MKIVVFSVVFKALAGNPPVFVFVLFIAYAVARHSREIKYTL